MPIQPAATQSAATNHDLAEDLAELHAALQRERWRLSWALVGKAVLLVASFALLIPLLAITLDHALPGGLPLQVISATGLMWVSGLAVVAVVLAGWWLLRRLSWAYVARRFERHSGVRHNAVLNAVLLSDNREASFATGAAARQAWIALEQAEPLPAPRRLPLGGLLLVITLALWLIYMLLQPKPIGPSLARFFGFALPAPTATSVARVSPAPGDVVYAGAPLQLVFDINGRTVESATFVRLEENVAAGAPLPLDAVPTANAPHRWRIQLAPHEVTAGTLAYTIAAGDAVFADTIEVRPEPRLVGVTVEIEPPAYTDLPARTTTDPELSVWFGTQARFAIESNAAISDPIFVHRGASEARTRMRTRASEPNVARVAVPLLESGEYRFLFTDDVGRAAESETFRVTVRRDTAPVVEVVEPRVSEPVLDVSDVPFLRVEARDDLRVNSLAVLVEQDDGTEQRVPLELADRGARLGHAIVTIPTAEFAVPAGGERRVRFIARDNYAERDGTPAPQVGSSASYTLTLANPPPSNAPRGPEPVELDEDGPTTNNAIGATRRRGSDGVNGTGEPTGEAGSGAGDAGTLDPELTAADLAERISGNAGENASATGQPGAGNGAADGQPPVTQEEMEQVADLIRELQEDYPELIEQLREQAGGSGDGAPLPEAEQGAESDEQTSQNDDAGGDGGGGGARDNAGEPAPGKDGDNADQSGADAGDAHRDQQAGDASDSASEPERAPPEAGDDSQEADPAVDPLDPNEAAAAPESTEEAGAPKSDEPVDTHEAGAQAEQQPTTQPAPESSQPSSTDAPEPSDAESTRSTEQSEREGESSSTAESESAPPGSNPSEAEQTGDRDASGQDEAPPDASDAQGIDAGNASAPDQAAGSAPEAQGEAPGAGETPGATDGVSDPDAPRGTGEESDAIAPQPPDQPPAPATPVAPEAGASAPADHNSDALDLIELLQRRGALDETLLDEFDAPPAQKRAFVERYNKVFERIEQVQALRANERWLQRVVLGDAGRVRGAGGAAGFGRGIEVSTLADALTGAGEQQQVVQPDLQRLLDAYYEALARQARAAEE